MLDLNRYGLADKWPKLRAMQEEIASLEYHKGKAEGEVAAAQGAISAAQERDAEAAAKAIRAGKDVPKATHEAKALGALEDAERTLAAYRKALADVESDLARFVAEHRDALRAAMVEALNENDRELAHHAREAARRYAFREDAKYDLKQFAPPLAPPDENAPAQRLSTTVIGVTTQRASGPNRGDVEAMLAYLASLGLAQPESGPVQPPSGTVKVGAA
jgi:hypothetical protein